MSLWGPSKGTLRCYTSICDGIISTFLNICITLNLHGRHLLIGLSPNSPQLSTTVHHLPIGCSDEKRKCLTLQRSPRFSHCIFPCSTNTFIENIFHNVFGHFLQAHTDILPKDKHTCWCHSSEFAIRLRLTNAIFVTIGLSSGPQGASWTFYSLEFFIFWLSPYAWNSGWFYE